MCEFERETQKKIEKEKERKRKKEGGRKKRGTNMVYFIFNFSPAGVDNPAFNWRQINSRKKHTYKFT